MALTFTLVREIDVSGGFPPDANPNLTAPDPLGVFPVDLRTQGQSSDTATRGVTIYVRALAADGAEVPTATFGFTAWGLDEGATAISPGPGGLARWVALAAEVGALSSAAYTTTFLGNLFVQLTAAVVAGVDRVQVWATARSL